MILILAVALLAPATTISITSWPFLIPEINNFLSSRQAVLSAGAVMVRGRARCTVVHMAIGHLDTHPQDKSTENLIAISMIYFLNLKMPP